MGPARILDVLDEVIPVLGLKTPTVGDEAPAGLALGLDLVVNGLDREVEVLGEVLHEVAEHH